MHYFFFMSRTTHVLKVFLTSVLVILAAMLLVLSRTTSAAALGTQDQQFSGSNTGYSHITSTTSFGQRFTAGLNGYLDRFTVNVVRIGNTGAMTAELFVSSNGVPSGAALATLTKPQSDFPSSDTAINFDFGTQYVVTAGTDYVMVFTAPSATGSDAFYFALGNNPPSSQARITKSGSNAWSPTTTGIWFTSYVAAVPVQTSTPSASASASANTPIPSQVEQSLANTGIPAESVSLIALSGFTMLTIGVLFINLLFGSKRRK